MIWIDTILKHVKTWNQNMMKYSNIWANGTKNVWRQSNSLDRCEQVERSKMVPPEWNREALRVSTNLSRWLADKSKPSITKFLIKRRMWSQINRWKSCWRRSGPTWGIPLCCITWVSDWQWNFLSMWWFNFEQQIYSDCSSLP